jgi:acetylglutamate kinase
MNGGITVVKIGGNVIDNPEALAAFIDDFSKISGPKILIHGGGKEATRLSARLGIKTRMEGGRRVTDRETLDIVTMIYAGLINKRIVAMLQAAGCDAVGMCGADGNSITATRRKPAPVDYGYVGDIDPAAVNADLIGKLLDMHLTPVFCAINHDGKGGLLNCNADTVASSVATACSRIGSTDLIFCFEKAGVLRDINDGNSVIRNISPATYPALISEGIIDGGMLPKIDNALKAVGEGVRSVTIKSSAGLLADSGTRISK